MPYGSDLSFNSYAPTRLVFGSGAVRDIGLEAKRLSAERVVIVTDAMLAKTPIVPAVAKALGSRLVGTYEGVIADTGVHIIDEGAAFAKSKGADCLVSVGGGSAIDTAKCMAIVLTEGGSIRDHQGSQRLTRRQTPHISVPTTAGTGAEVTMYAVVKDHEKHEKMHFSEEHVMPDAAVLDPDLTLGLPPKLTAATGLDALTHAIEAYVGLGRNPIADSQALHAIRIIVRYLPTATKDGSDKVARGQMLLAAMLGGLAINTGGVGLAHAMAHVVGARYGIHHGTANAIVLPHVMRFNNDELAERYRDIAEAMGVDVRGHSDEAAGLAAADAVEKLVGDLGLPTRLRQANVPEAEVDACAEGSLSDGAIVFNGKFCADKDMVLGVYREAF